MTPEPSTVVLDAGALIAVERGLPTMRALILEAQRSQRVLTVPGPVVGQAWRGGARQTLLARFLALPLVEVDLLTRKLWQAAGVLCGRTGTSARERGARVIVTTDPSDLRRLDESIALRTP
jgi:hypothetical protein